jgi:hypothetical protein
MWDETPEMRGLDASSGWSCGEARAVLLQWYPRTRLEMDPDQRAEKRSKFGGVKYVYPREVMTRMRQWFDAELARRLPAARILYWTEPLPDRGGD